MTLDETFALANGVTIPKLGLGTWRISDDEAARVVRDAIALGYRHIDTAQAYANERGVGEGLRASGVDRDRIFVTTKLAAECKTYAQAQDRIDGSLRTLGLDQIDLMLIHSPQPWAEFREGGRFFEGNLEAWRALEDAYEAGKLRAIGVSNFERKDLDNLIDYSRSRGILVEAYSPVAHGALLKSAELGALAEKYGVSIPQLCIRYCLQLGLLPLPKTATAAHMQANAAVDFEISDADMEMLKTARDDTDYGAAGAFPVFGKKRRPDQ